LEVNATPPELVAELDEQLDCAPPTLADEAASTLLGFVIKFPSIAFLGPSAIIEVPENDRVELVEALELLAQLPELPVTLVWPRALCVLDELLQLYAIVVLGVVMINSVAATKMAPFQIKLFNIHCGYKMFFRRDNAAITNERLWPIQMLAIKPF
jgi:hypothetical protein